MKRFVLALCAAWVLLVGACGEALAERWHAATTVSCPNCKVRELGRKLYQAIEDAAFRKNQPVTLISGNTEQLTYSLRLSDTGGDYFDSKGDCQNASVIFEAGVREVFEEYNPGENLKFKHQCARGK